MSLSPLYCLFIDFSIPLLPLPRHFVYHIHFLFGLSVVILFLTFISSLFLLSLTCYFSVIVLRYTIDLKCCNPTHLYRVLYYCPIVVVVPGVMGPSRACLSPW